MAELCRFALDKYTMKKTTLALLTFLTVTGCKKDTDRSGPCGPDETIVHHELVIDTNFSDHSLDLHLQGDPYIIGDSLYADFVFDDAYGGEVGFYRNSNWFRSLPQQIEVKARFVNQLPPACDASISLHGPWDLRPIRDLVELYDGDTIRKVIIRVETENGSDVFLDYTW
jgi:hypothetical protein